jgi:hypothetical protein
MSQHDYDVANGSGSTVRADINAVLGAIASLNAGSSEPDPTFPNMWWWDDTNHVLKKRNESNTAWQVVLAETAATVIIDTAGTTAVGAADGTIIFNLGSAGANELTLPAVADRLGLPLHIVDFSGNAGDITVTPNGTESTMVATIGSGGNVTLNPSTDLNGWYL